MLAILLFSSQFLPKCGIKGNKGQSREKSQKEYIEDGRFLRYLCG